MYLLKEALSLITQMAASNNNNVILPSICSMFFCANKNIFLYQEIGAPGHGKDLVDGLNECDKQHLKQ